MEKEIWKGVIYNGINYGKYYEASNLGKVRNTKTKKNLKLSIGNKGYYHFTMRNKKEGLILRCSIHKVMAETFIPNPNNYPIVNHKDGNKRNWSLDNLEWCTYSYNAKHAYENNLHEKKYGENNRNHKLTQEQVDYIRNNYIKGNRQYGARALAKTFNVSKTTIIKIVNKLMW